MAPRFEKAVGIEVEFFVKNDKGEVVMPGTNLDRDDFPLLGEIRAVQGKTMAEALGNFYRKKVEMEALLTKKQVMSISHFELAKLKVYQEAIRLITAPKNSKDIRNIYGIDISGFTDQVVKDGKIQGANVSCGLHIHLSCREIDEVKVEQDVYSAVSIPITTTASKDVIGLTHLVTPCLSLFKHEGTKIERTLMASTSKLNQPTIEYIVRAFDEKFFKRFAPKKEECTKYRQPGFFERKSYGFEYRSLPANAETINALPEIVGFAFDMLKLASS